MPTAATASLMETALAVVQGHLSRFLPEYPQAVELTREAVQEAVANVCLEEEADGVNLVIGDSRYLASTQWMRVYDLFTGDWVDPDDLPQPGVTIFLDLCQLVRQSL